MGRHMNPRYDHILLVCGLLFKQLSIDHIVDVKFHHHHHHHHHHQISRCNINSLETYW